jgi:DNA-binding SARP family transcriptional activator
MADLLQVSLFGGFQLNLEGVGGCRKLTYTTQSLLVFLLLYRHKAHSRDVLAGIFWKDFPQERARNCLNTTLWRLRGCLEPKGISPGTYLISTPNGELGFNTQCDYWLDVDIFEKQIFKLLAIPANNIGVEDISILEKATQLYSGDLLEGYYCDWVLRERERLRCCYLDCLYYLMFFFTAKEHIIKALTYGQDILTIDPLREDVYRHMMRLYMKNGQRSLAIKQFNLCGRILEKELGVPPMDETQELYTHIIKYDATMEGKKTAPVELQQALEKLNQAVHNMSRAQRNPQHLLEL